MQQGGVQFLCFHQSCKQGNLFSNTSNIDDHSGHKFLSVQKIRTRINSSASFKELKESTHKLNLTQEPLQQFSSSYLQEVSQQINNIIQQDLRIFWIHMLEVFSQPIQQSDVNEFSSEVHHLQDPNFIDQTLQDLEGFNSALKTLVEKFKEKLVLQCQFLINDVTKLTKKKAPSKIQIIQSNDSSELKDQSSFQSSDFDGAKFELAEIEKISTFAEKFHNLQFVVDAKQNQSFPELELQVAYAQIELPEIQMKSDYGNPKMDLAILQINWFNKMMRQPNEVSTSYFKRIIPDNAFYKNQPDIDHNLVYLSIEVGQKVYGTQPAEYANYLLSLGRAMNYIFNTNLFEPERDVLERAINIFSELQIFREYLIARACLGNTIYKSGLINEALEIYDVILSEIPLLFNNGLVQQDLMRRFVLREIVALPCRQVIHPKIIEYENLLRTLQDAYN